MNADESADYALWLARANDPSQTDETRQHYRARMEDSVRARLANAFRFAAETAVPPDEPG